MFNTDIGTNSSKFHECYIIDNYKYIQGVWSDEIQGGLVMPGKDSML